MKTSYQLFSSRNFGPLPDTLKMLSELGYQQVEGYGALYADLADPASLSDTLAANGLEMPSAHFGLDLIEDDPDRAIAIADALGIKQIYVPDLDAAARPTNAEEWRTFGARVEEAGKPLVAAGLTFGWHNHDFEFTLTSDGAMPIEAMFEGGPSLALEFDVAWCARAGQDPFEWIDRLGARTRAAHVKDIAAEGTNLDQDGWSDVGEGTMDWRGLMGALRKTDCDLFIMEHDNPSDDRRFAASSITFLNSA